MKHFVLLCAMALSLSGCDFRTSQSHRLVDESRFVTVYSAVLAENICSRKEGLGPDSSAARVDSLLAHEGMTRAEFAATVAWYNADPHRWKSFYDSVTHALEARAREMTQR